MAETAALLARLAVGGVFLAAGLGKLLDGRGAGEQAVEYALLPARLARLHGRALPWLELGTGLLLLAGFFLPAGSPLRPLPFYLALVLLASFSLAVVVILARGQEAECHCFGRFGGGRVTGWTLGRIILLMAGAGAGLRGARAGSLNLARVTADVGSMPMLLLALAALAVLAMAAEAGSVGADARRARTARARRERALKE
jgi:uncharacterized membrane protein YphA (DoxX/SURF4 family)